MIFQSVGVWKMGTRSRPFTPTQATRVGCDLTSTQPIKGSSLLPITRRIKMPDHGFMQWTWMEVIARCCVILVGRSGSYHMQSRSVMPQVRSITHLTLWKIITLRIANASAQVVCNNSPVMGQPSPPTLSVRGTSMTWKLMKSTAMFTTPSTQLSVVHQAVLPESAA